MKTVPWRSHTRALWAFLTVAVGLGSAGSVCAHVGSPTVFYEGDAGPYRTRIAIRPPEVIPGLATVSVRVFSPDVERVTALPIRWNTGHNGAPPPDEALPVRGETNLYSTQLWFMQGGAQSVEVEFTGRAGQGKVLVPVSVVATRVLPMPRALGYGLATFGGVLVLLLAAMVGAAVRESVLVPGLLPGAGRRWGARGATVVAVLVLCGLAWLGKRWWDGEALDYRNNRLYRPLQTAVNVQTTEGHRVLKVQLMDEAFFRGPPLVPDHGKLMHLFVVREPGMDLFGHVHPEKVDWRTFETELPDLPEGTYSLYGDITYETGFSDTLTAQVKLGASPAAAIPPAALAPVDPDDAWRTAPALAREGLASGQSQTLHARDGREYRMNWTAGPALTANREATLRFTLRDSSGQPLVPEPYLGMAGHLVLRRDDGAVFTHLHPGGSFSMAAQELFAMRSDGRAPLKVASSTNDPICRLPTSAELEVLARSALAQGGAEEIAFPYAFPKPGRYRLWVQVKVHGEVLTGVFDAAVEDS